MINVPNSRSTTPRLGYRADIDGLRAIAIIAVVMFHAFPKLLPGGFVGVDVFFVISGYLITRIIYEAQASEAFSFQTFYIHRARRILPALILMVASSLVIGHFILLPNEFEALGKHVVAGATYTSNILLITESGYFDFASDSKPLLHLWSLGVEEQFYFIWPVLVLAVVNRKISPKKLTASLLVASFVFNVLTVDSWPTATFYGPISRIWELLIGALLVFENRKASRVGKAFSRDLISWGGCVLIVWSLIETSVGMPMPGWWALFPTVGTACVIVAGPESWFNKKVLGNKLLVSIGLVSYPLYLWHWPLLSFARIVEGHQVSDSIRLVIVSISVILAIATYFLFEKPIRRFSSLTMAATLVFTLSITGVLGYWVFLNSGFPKSGVLNSESLARFSNDNEWKNGGWNFQSECPAKFGKSFHFYCVAYDLQAPPTALLIGDSNANQFYPGLSIQFAQRNENLLNLGQAGCPPLFGVNVTMKEGDLHCNAVMDEALQFSIDQPKIKTVILSMLGVGYSIGRRSVNETETNYAKLIKVGQPNLNSNLSVMEIALRETFKRLTETKKNIIFVISAPMMDFEPSTCVDIRPWRITPAKLTSPCSISRAQVDALDVQYRQMVLRVSNAYPQVKIVDVPKELCDNVSCLAMHDGKLLYRDSEHLSVYGSKFVAERIRAQIFP